MNILSDFQFLRPQFLWLILLLFTLPFILRQAVSSSNAWEKVCDKVLLEYLMAAKETNLQKKFNFWIYLSFLSAIIALSGPSFKQTVQPIALKETPLMVVLDLSSDMNRLENSISRLSRAKIEISDILKKSQAAPSGLIVYTYEPFLISPLAYDSNIIVNLLPAVGSDIMPVGGNKVDRAIDLAVSKFQSNNFKEGNILLFTADIPLDFDGALLAAQKASNSGYKISVYGLSPKTNEKLERLAKTGGGTYINTGYASSESLIKLLKNTQSEDYNENKNTVSIPEDDGLFFVAISIFCLLRLFLGSLFVFAALFFVPIDSYAGFFYNQNQEGALMFSSREYNKAAEKFENTDWKAAAYYKAGDYESALKILQDKKDITSLYNKGNALAKSGKIKEAIKTYEEVLKQDPNHEDAEFNLEYLKKLAEQQQSNQKKENQKKENQKQQDQQQQEQQQQNQDQSSDKQDQKNDNNNADGQTNTQTDESPEEDDKQKDDQQQQNQDQQSDQNQQEQEQQDQDLEQEQNQKQTQRQNKTQNQDDQNKDSDNDNQNDQDKQDNEEQGKNKSQDKPAQPEEQEDEKPDEQSDQNQNKDNDLQNDMSQQQTQAPVMPAKEQDADEYDETVQVREQRFRAIKENPGGLLKAFIKEEYLKKRYGN